jgi:hypothetical protein
LYLALSALSQDFTTRVHCRQTFSRHFKTFHLLV